MRVFNAEQTRALLPFHALRTSLIAVLAASRAGRTQCPARLQMPLPGGAVLLLMPAGDEELAVVKTVTVNAVNRGSALPVVQAEVLLLDACSGKRLMLLDGDVVTERRTATLSALAVQRMRASHEAAGSLLVIGSGVQAWAHIEAFAALLGVKRVLIHGKNPAACAAMAKRAQSLGLAAEVVASVEEASAAADLIVTATSSATPVLPDTVKPAAIICAVGAFTPHMAELPAALVLRSQLVVDTQVGCQREAGDLIQAGVDFSGVIALQNAEPSRFNADAPRIFKSVGSALWDLAAAHCALDSPDIS
jgi:1-piperideine-2-carboxylate/1-pyrroline-2-carboxylate reductase [NAD(P)H]